MRNHDGRFSGTLKEAVPPPSQRSEGFPGTVVGGRFRLVSRLGEGACGDVWLAKHVTLGTRVAVKLSAATEDHAEHALRCYRREALIGAQLSARHTLHVIDFGVTLEGRAFIVMEYVDGETLDGRLQREGVLAPDAALSILTQAGGTLGRIHSLGFVHRDFKPSNVMLGYDEAGQREVRVIDFSIACRASWAPANGLDEDGGLMDDTRQRVVGSPLYMAPEQTHGEGVTEACDQWAFGVVAYEMLTGTLPFLAESLGDLFTAIRGGAFVPPSQVNSALRPELDAWMATVLQVEAERRFRNMPACVDALGAALAGALANATPMEDAAHTQATAITQPPFSWHAPAPRRRGAGWAVGAAMLSVGAVVALNEYVNATPRAVVAHIAAPVVAPAKQSRARETEVAIHPGAALASDVPGAAPMATGAGKVAPMRARPRAGVAPARPAADERQVAADPFMPPGYREIPY